MKIGRKAVQTGLAVALLLSAAWLIGTAHAADEDVLRKIALALNDITGENTIRGEIKTLTEDPAGTRKLLATAMAMAKEKNQPFNYNAAYILARAALQLKELEASRAFYRICAEESAKLQSAQKLVQAYSGTLSIIDFLYLDKKYEESVKLSQEFLEILDRQGVSARFKADVLRRMSRAMVKQGKVEEATKLVDNLVKSRDSDWRNLELKAWLQNETGHFEDAVKTYESVIERIAKDAALEKEEKTELQNEVRQRMIRALAKLGKIDEANKLIDTIAKGKENDWRHLELKASLQQETGHFNEAAKIYETILEKVAKDDALEAEQKTEIQAEVRYILSSIYVDAERIDKATEHLQALLAKEPDSPRYNNDLGYIWADHDKNLDEAEKMIRKALDEDRKQRQARPDLRAEEDKDSSAYLDSLGWVLFKKKQYQEAKKYLLEAIKDKEGQHVEIMDHLGDVHMAVGEKAEAIAVWQRALDLEAPSKREQAKKTEVEKKLKAQQK